MKRLISAILICVASIALPETPAPVVTETPPAVISKKPRPYLEARAGYFFFLDPVMSQIYNHGGLDLQLCGGAPICPYLRFYVSAEYLHRSGRSQGAGQKTSIWQYMTSIGLQPVIPIASCMDFYITAGPRYFFSKTHQNSTYVPTHMHANGIGPFANTGFMFKWGLLAVDIYGEYSWARLDFHSHKENTQGKTAQVGGLSFGGGLAFQF